MSILKCKGKGKAANFQGCGNELKYTERNGIKTYYSKKGLCTTGNRCYSRWLVETEQGQELIIKASKKAKMYSVQETKKTYNKEKKERKWELMSTVQRINKAKQVFQKWIRKRDKDDPCISCGTVSSDLWDGGHYLKAEIYTGVIFNEMNVHKQCRKCNRFLGGNEAQYRIALCLKYGESKVAELEKLANETRQYRWSSEELKKIIDIYK